MCVVHYQLPASADTYIHRSGRTARVEAEGISIALVTPKEAPRFRALIYALQRQKMPPEFPVDASLFYKVKERAKVAEQIMLLERTMREERTTETWIQRSAKELDLDLSEEEEEEEEEVAEKVYQRKKKEGELQELRTKLMELISQPLVTNISWKFLAGGQSVGDEGNVRSAVNVAQELASRYKASATTTKPMKTNQHQNQNQGKKEQLSLKQLREQALQDELKRRENKKKGKWKPFTVSSKTMVGRDDGNINALETLKSKLAIVERAREQEKTV
eukprot:TRINITY_DN1915_c3_g1_i3.p2 TRINITY_DN1915_c3_g1~~TRINITY_DN1915_c3_g1_i3.p2  ORF type:complete len:275 (+),score=59.74 TRINITY_DN1915_c3_g1_i3:139-963(+)